jgi:hypothetical protein
MNMELNTWWSGYPSHPKCFFFKNKKQFIGVEYNLEEKNWFVDFWDEDVLQVMTPFRLDVPSETMRAMKHDVLSSIFTSSKYLA